MRVGTHAVTSSQIQAVHVLQELLGATQLTVDGMWATLTRELDLDEESLKMTALGRPGLWKSLGSGRCPRRLFEVPLYIVDLMGEEGGECRFAGLKHLVAWALATEGGSPPEGWVAPTAEEAVRMIGPDLLTVQCADSAAQGRIVRAENRLAIVFPIPPLIASALPESRRQHLHELVRNTNDSWRMVRVDLSGPGGQSAVAEVDLTGAPLPALEALLTYGTDAIHHVIRWVAGAASLIASDQPCELLDHQLPGGGRR
jgi:hypothetical protein